MMASRVHENEAGTQSEYFGAEIGEKGIASLIAVFIIVAVQLVGTQVSTNGEARKPSRSSHSAEVTHNSPPWACKLDTSVKSTLDGSIRLRPR
jgi:hypothetical protein